MPARDQYFHAQCQRQHGAHAPREDLALIYSGIDYFAPARPSVFLRSGPEDASGRPGSAAARLASPCPCPACLCFAYDVPANRRLANQSHDHSAGPPSHPPFKTIFPGGNPLALDLGRAIGRESTTFLLSRAGVTTMLVPRSPRLQLNRLSDSRVGSGGRDRVDALFGFPGGAVKPSFVSPIPLPSLFFVPLFFSLPRPEKSALLLAYFRRSSICRRLRQPRNRTRPGCHPARLSELDLFPQPRLGHRSLFHLPSEPKKSTFHLGPGPRPPKTPMEIYLVAGQWMWKRQHLCGQQERSKPRIHVPNSTKTQSTAVRLTNAGVTRFKQDVIHIFLSCRPFAFHQTSYAGD